MFSSVLSPFDNISVRQHPYIICLLKWVFNSRPLTITVLPDWDLHKVLGNLRQLFYL